MDRSVHNITNYDSLMTPQERSALRQLTLQEKANLAKSPAMKKALNTLMSDCGSQDPETLALVEIGWERFLQTVHDRILRDHPGQVNRCPKCQKLAATRQAKQCFACGHDWHDAM